MIINKLTPSVRVPLKISKGSFKQRQIKSNNLTEALFKNISKDIKGDNSTFSYEQLQQYINNVLPDKNFKIIIQNLAKEDAAEYDSICDALFDANNNIIALSINLSGINNTIKASNIPSFIHEFLHAADNLFHPKYLSRLQNLSKKGLMSKKYSDFYDNYYYCTEMIGSKRERKYAIKDIKNKTQKFLKGYGISDKLDYMQDMRYCIITEKEAYKMEKKVARELKSKGINVPESYITDWEKEFMFEEKLDLLKNMAAEYIKKYRSKNSCLLNKRKH